MKVAYIFTTPLSQKILETIVLPQLGEGRHGVEVAGILFGDCVFYLLKDAPMGNRLRKMPKQNGMLLMGCDQCAYERNIATSLVEGAKIWCFPDLYAALGPAKPDQVITL